MRTGSHPTRIRRLVAELPATIAAMGVAVIVEVGLRATTLPRLSRLLGAPLASGGDGATPRADVTELPGWAQRRLRATRRVLRRWPFGDTCLRQALVGGQRLRRLRPRLHIGVARIDGEVRAHAWLVIDGRVVDHLRAVGSYLDLAPPAGGGPR